jgi:hypothetical protein
MHAGNHMGIMTTFKKPTAERWAEGVVEHEEARALPPPTWVEMGALYPVLR